MNFNPEEIEEIKKQILIVMSSDLTRSWDIGKIKRKLNDHIILKNNEIEYYLNLLLQDSFVERIKIKPTERIYSNKNSIPARVYYKYQISKNGLNFIKNDFKYEEHPSNSQIIMCGQQFNFGSFTNINIDINQIMDEAKLDKKIKEEIKLYLDDLEKEA